MYLSLQILQTGRHRVPQPLDVDLNFQMGGVLGKSVTFEANYVTANTSPQCATLLFKRLTLEFLLLWCGSCYVEFSY